MVDESSTISVRLLTTLNSTIDLKISLVAMRQANVLNVAFYDEFDVSYTKFLEINCIDLEEAIPQLRGSISAPEKLNS